MILPQLPHEVTVTISELVKLEAEAARCVGLVAGCEDGGLEQLLALNAEARQALQLMDDKARVWCVRVCLSLLESMEIISKTY